MIALKDAGLRAFIVKENNFLGKPFFFWAVCTSPSMARKAGIGELDRYALHGKAHTARKEAIEDFQKFYRLNPWVFRYVKVPKYMGVLK